jgi:N-acetylglucosaminyldiphosphoundecaprenol N-acetyl-beta-D-mannosaminyltransferase
MLQPSPPRTVPFTNTPLPSRPMIDTVELFGMTISRVSMLDTLGILLKWCAAPRADACRYVVTPNVDHVVMFQHRADLREAYAEASLVLADGSPLVLASPGAT